MGHERNAETAGAPLRWTRAPQWYLWDGGFLVLGTSEGIVPLHSHHAIQIVIATHGTVAVRQARGDWREGRGVIVRQDTEHVYDGKGASGAMLFVDPESNEGAWLRSGLVEDITVLSDARMTPWVPALQAFHTRPPDSTGIRELIRACVLSLCPGTPPARRPDERVTRVLDAIRASDELRISLADAAEGVFLSPSRFAHLFKEQVGLPFRRYVLWRKVTRAMLSIGRGHSIAAAAQASDFADAAHLTRTFHQMFGIAPSVMMRGDFFPISSPFR